MIILVILVLIFAISVVLFCCLRMNKVTEKYEKELDQASEEIWNDFREAAEKSCRILRQK